MAKPRFRAISVVLKELAKIPAYDAEGNRLYRNIRRAGKREAQQAEGRPRETGASDRVRVKSLRPAGLASL